MTIFRRFFVLQLFMLWQGGFLFYAGVVVPIGTEVLGSSFEQGKITRLVTRSMNVIGAIAVAAFAWDLLQAPPRTKVKKRLLWGSWLVMAGGLLTLFALHPRMLEMIDFESSKYLVDRGDFRFLHRTYLWVSTFQWMAGLIFARVLLQSWRESDRTG